MMGDEWVDGWNWSKTWFKELLTQQHIQPIFCSKNYDEDKFNNLKLAPQC
jgi:hypothetical protein